MTGLLSLPVELLRLVCRRCSELPNRRGTKALWSLCLANKFCNEVATPILYANVTLEKIDLVDDVKSVYKALCFVSSVLTNPERAGQVFNLELEGVIDEVQTPTGVVATAFARTRSIAALPKILSEQVYEKFGPDSAMMACLRDSPERLRRLGFMLAVATSFLPRLRILSVKSMFYRNDGNRHRQADILETGSLWDDFETVINACSSQTPGPDPPGFIGIEHVLITEEENGECLFCYIKPFLRLPSLKTFRLENVDVMQVCNFSDAQHSISGASGATTFELDAHIQLSSDDFMQLIRSFRHLEAFKHKAGPLGLGRCPTMQDLRTAIHQHRNSLRAISVHWAIHVEDRNIGGMEREVAAEPMDFRQCAALEALEISLPLVFGDRALGFNRRFTLQRSLWPPTLADLHRTRTTLVDCLPPSLVKLALIIHDDTWACARLNEALVYLLQNKLHAAPALATLEFILEHQDFEADNDVFDEREDDELYPSSTTPELMAALRPAIALARQSAVRVVFAAQTPSAVKAARPFCDHAFEMTDKHWSLERFYPGTNST